MCDVSGLQLAKSSHETTAKLQLKTRAHTAKARYAAALLCRDRPLESLESRGVKLARLRWLMIDREPPTRNWLVTLSPASAAAAAND